MLIGEDLWFRHSRHEPWLLAGVDIRVEPGSVVGLRGPSGRGKSTLAAVLAGMRTPHRGSVTVDGRPLTALRGSRPVQLVTQRPETAMDPRWRISRVLAEAGPANAGRSVDGPAEDKSSMDGTALDGAALDGPAVDGPAVDGPAAGGDDLVEPAWLDRFPHEISGGELQRVNLARALRAGPAYLLADEISSSLDAITQAMLWSHLLERVRRDGLGVLAISHDSALLAAVADVVLELGELHKSAAWT